MADDQAALFAAVQIAIARNYDIERTLRVASHCLEWLDAQGE